MVMEAKALLENNPKPTEDEIKEAISRHICRCTGYIKIIEAISLASKKMLSNLPE
jgi:carbon-monoxide dehydrogenase small subunit